MRIKVFNAGVPPSLIRKYFQIFGWEAPVPHILMSYFYADGILEELIGLCNSIFQIKMASPTNPVAVK